MCVLMRGDPYIFNQSSSDAHAAAVGERSPPASSSLRDPSGFMFQEGGQWFRQVNERYRPDFEALVGSGLYDELVAAGALAPRAAFSQLWTFASEELSVGRNVSCLEWNPENKDLLAAA